MKLARSSAASLEGLQAGPPVFLSFCDGRGRDRVVRSKTKRQLALPHAGRHCGAAERRAAEKFSLHRGATALKRTIFGLMAFFLLVPLARAGSGPAQLNLYDTPAEARWAPFVADMPACEDSGVLSTISERFSGTQREFWNSNLAIGWLRSSARDRISIEWPVLHSAPLLRRPGGNVRSEGANRRLRRGDATRLCRK